MRLAFVSQNGEMRCRTSDPCQEKLESAPVDWGQGRWLPPCKWTQQTSEGRYIDEDTVVGSGGDVRSRRLRPCRYHGSAKRSSDFHANRSTDAHADCPAALPR